MSSTSTAFFTIGRKLGILLAAVAAVLVAFCAAVVVELAGMRRDAGLLLEETREAGLCASLRGELEDLALLVDRRVAAAVATAAPEVGDRIAGVRALLDQLDRGPEDQADPSRTEHQTAEARLTDRIRRAIDALEPGPGGAVPQVDEGSLGHALDCAAVLADETREEAELANADLVLRAGRTWRLMLSTVAAVVVALTAALWSIRRSVVTPLRTLRDRVEQVGRGERPAGPVAFRSRDEIGVLARAFEEMASRVNSTQDDLRQRVESRTRELMRAARYADIGVLAAGVAHEINNPLGSIASCAEGLERRLRRREVPLDEQLDDLRTIAAEAYRARGITGRLLALARPERAPDGVADLAEIARQVEAVTRYQFQERGVRLELELPDEGPRVVGDAGDLLQLLANLVSNARDASPRGALVRVRVRPAGDGRVEVVVDDAGPGVPESDQQRIFDPFFTTKEVGKGTGLGLALVAAIVESHAGTIDVGRSPDGGARFTVRLRAAAEVRA